MQNLKTAHPLLFVFTGPSGVGKNTVMRAMLTQVPGLTKAINFATRPPRPGEVAGEDYHFIGADDFRSRIASGEIFEYEQVYQDHYYGSPRQIFDPSGVDGDKIIELDYKGTRKYRGLFGPRLIAIFIAPPSIEALIDRIEKRSQESNLESRIRNALDQLRHADEYDYVLYNDVAEECVETARGIFLVERCRRDRPLVQENIRRAVDEALARRK